MGSDQDEPPAVQSIWSRLILNVRQTKDTGQETSEADAVERQTENSRRGGTIWQAALKADFESLKRLIAEDPKIVDSRGAVGECPIHMLFLYGSEVHLQMARYIITNFPHTITQIYNGAVNKN